MDERFEQLSAYEQSLDRILRRGQDVNFEDVESELKQILWFLKHYYEKDEYRRVFSKKQKKDIELLFYAPFTSMINDVIARDSWNTSDAFQIFNNWRDQIKRAHEKLVEEGYLVRLQSAVAVDGNLIAGIGSRFAQESETLLKQQQQMLESAQKQSTDFFNQIAQQQVDVERKLSEIKHSSDKAQKTLAKQIKSSQGVEFRMLSEIYARIAKRWLTAQIAVSAIALGVLTWLIIEIIRDPSSLGSNFIASSIKIGVFLLGFYGIQITGKNYSANKHLEVTNRQRATVLAVINEMVNSVDDNSYKDYLLTYAAKTVFDHGETGFISRNYGAGSNDDSTLDTLLKGLQRP